MKTKTWILLFALILIVSLGASFYLFSPGETSTHAEITSYGQVIKTVDLRINQEFTIEHAGGGYNVVTVTDGKIGVTDASCPDHYCMKRGWCAGGNQIVCLPNRLVLQFTDKAPLDGVSG